VGSKKNPVWRVVVSDQRAPRDGRSIETLGHYNPQTQPSTIVVDRERLDYWLKRGAQPSGSVKKLMRAPNTEAPASKAASPAVVEEATADAATEQAEAPADVAGAVEPEVEATPAEPAADAEQASAGDADSA
jgi:small subunit ribosomal protein S16